MEPYPGCDSPPSQITSWLKAAAYSRDAKAADVIHSPAEAYLCRADAAPRTCQKRGCLRLGRLHLACVCVCLCGRAGGRGRRSPTRAGRAAAATRVRASRALAICGHTARWRQPPQPRRAAGAVQARSPRPSGSGRSVSCVSGDVTNSLQLVASFSGAHKHMQLVTRPLVMMRSKRVSTRQAGHA